MPRNSKPEKSDPAKRPHKGHKNALYLTEAQLETLGDDLLGTTQNAYFLVKQRHGLDAGGELFNRLWAERGLGRCSECNFWKNSDAFPDANDEPPSSPCGECVDEIDLANR